jgi:hypothetical protein
MTLIIVKLSGVINVYRYVKDYSPGREPQFIEDKLFRTKKFLP